MIINLIKFIHVLLALSLLGLTTYCVAQTDSYAQKKFTALNKTLLIISVFALLTGSLLIFPKHYTFHTPWIQAAYLLLITYCIIMRLSIVLKEKITHPWIWRTLYVFLIMILVLITHDAVGKHTFFTQDLLKLI